MKPTTTSAAALAQRAQAVGEAVAADRVEHDVDAAAGGLLGLVLPRAVGAQHLVGAGLARHALLLVAGDDREHAAAEALGDLDRGGPDAAGGAVHEHGLALLEAAAQHEREVGRVVVEDQPGALGEVQRVGQREGQEVGRDGDLGEAAEHAERRHPVAGLHAGALGRAAHDAGDLAARDERQRRLDLVLAARLQDLGERHAGRADVDDDAFGVGHRVGGARLGTSPRVSAEAGPESSVICWARMRARILPGILPPMGAGPRPREVPLSDVIGALSYALDLTEGEPPGHAVRTCMIGMRLAQELGLGEAERTDLFYALLLKDAGCSANSARMAALFAVDDRHAKRSSKRVDWARSYTAFLWTLRTVAPGGSLRSRAVAADVDPPGDRDHPLADARPLRPRERRSRGCSGSAPGTAAAIRGLDEHWDGHGQPEGQRGDEIPLGGRILCLAQTVEIFHAARGLDAALRVAARRSGGWFDPRLVAALKRTRADIAFWALAAGRRAGAVGAAGAAPDRRRGLPGPDRRRVRRRRGREVAVDLPPLRPHVRDRDEHRGAARLRRPRARRHAPRGAAARRRQARDLQPDPRQARAADRRGVRGRPPPSAAHGLDPRAHARLRAGWRPVAGAHHERLDGSGYPHGLDARRADACRCACSRSPTSTRR